MNDESAEFSSSDSMHESVRVAIRLRPRNLPATELSNDAAHEFLSLNEENGTVHFGRKRRSLQYSQMHSQSNFYERDMVFSYDKVFGEQASQEEIFQYVHDSVQQVVQGFNCTIFAYGQTGTGKTHTMIGDIVLPYPALPKTRNSPAHIKSLFSNEHKYNTEWGIIPRSVHALFKELQSIEKMGAAAVVHCSFIQLYNNDLTDLLVEHNAFKEKNKKTSSVEKHKSKSPTMKSSMSIRELIKGNEKQVYVSGLSSFRVTNIEETLALLAFGNGNRAIRATEYNETSSRSHALFQLSIEVESRGAEGTSTIIRRAKLTLVDLAGSEKWRTTTKVNNVEEEKELTCINSSLSALGNVISALSDPKRSHIPYRDSKLTRLLQDSLGGNTRTIVIATISHDTRDSGSEFPESCSEETLSTLQFAERAKKVVSRVHVNEVVDDTVLLLHAQKEIARLKQIAKIQLALESTITSLRVKIASIGPLEQENKLLKEQNARLKMRLKELNGGKILRNPINEAPANIICKGNHINDFEHSQNMESHHRRHIPETIVEENNRECTNFLPYSQDSEESDHAKYVVTHGERSLDNEVGSEKEELKLLDKIISERRSLELGLEKISKANPASSKQDEKCPVCHVIIDDHSDEQLDSCISEENRCMMFQNKNRTNSKSNFVGDVDSPEIDLEGENPAFENELSSMQDITFIDVQNNRNQQQPNLSSIPYNKNRQERITVRQSDINAKHSSLRGCITKDVDGHNTTTRVRSVYPSCAKPEKGTIHKRGSSHSEANTTPKQNNVAEENQGPHSSSLQRQGLKGIKALKRLHASSPYSSSRRYTKLTLSNSHENVQGNSRGNSRGNSSRGTTPSSSKVKAESHEGPLNYSVKDIGLSLRVYKFRYDCWYPCIIVGYDGKRKLHCCQYEYGDKQWQDLSRGKFELNNHPQDD